MDYLSLSSDLIGITGAIFALLAWLQSRMLRDEIARERERMEQEVSIKMVLSGSNQEQEKILPLNLKRRELTRAELLGRIGMIPMREPGRRFSLAYLSTPDFLSQINIAQVAGHVFTIIIPCSEVEFNQFI